MGRCGQTPRNAWSSQRLEEARNRFSPRTCRRSTALPTPGFRTSGLQDRESECLRCRPPGLCRFAPAAAGDSQSVPGLSPSHLSLSPVSFRLRIHRLSHHLPSSGFTRAVPWLPASNRATTAPVAFQNSALLIAKDFPNTTLTPPEYILFPHIVPGIFWGRE